MSSGTACIPPRARELSPSSGPPDHTLDAFTYLPALLVQLGEVGPHGSGSTRFKPPGVRMCVTNPGDAASVAKEEAQPWTSQLSANSGRSRGYLFAPSSPAITSAPTLMFPRVLSQFSDAE